MHFLNGMCKLQPRVMVINEQKSNVNGSLTERVDKVLDFYGALFSFLESTVSNTQQLERILMERTLLREEIKNIVSFEGAERKERHEKFYTWVPRLEMDGFEKGHISHHGIRQATKHGLEMVGYGNGYKLVCLENNCLFVCWNDKPLFSVSTWTL